MLRRLRNSSWGHVTWGQYFLYCSVRQWNTASKQGVLVVLHGQCLPPCSTAQEHAADQCTLIDSPRLRGRACYEMAFAIGCTGAHPVAMSAEGVLKPTGLLLVLLVVLSV